MTAKEVEKLMDELQQLAVEYTKAAQENWRSLPGEAHRLMNLADMCDTITEDLQKVYSNLELEELNATL